MMIVSPIMNAQFEKDLVLDFVGIPAILTSVIYTFLHIEKLIDAATNNKLLFYKHILLREILFLLSFLLLADYSLLVTTV